MLTAAEICRPTKYSTGQSPVAITRDTLSDTGEIVLSVNLIPAQIVVQSSANELLWCQTPESFSWVAGTYRLFSCQFDYLRESMFPSTGELKNQLVGTRHNLPTDPDAGASNSFFANVEDYALDDWDGDGAKAVSHEDVHLARTLLGRLCTSQPEIAAGSDGSICMEWIRQVPWGERKIYVDIGPNGKVLTFARFEDSSPVEKHFDEYSPEVDSHLRALFNRYST